MRLASLHAVHQMVGLARAARAAVVEGRYAAFRAAFLEKFRSRATLAPVAGGA
jgi:queuine/archaeosine tRNA-ribosyltransferase